MASLNVTHHEDKIVFTFTVNLDEIDLSQFGPGQAVSASTEPPPAEQPAEPAPSAEGEPEQPPA